MDNVMEKVAKGIADGSIQIDVDSETAERIAVEWMRLEWARFHANTAGCFAAFAVTMLVIGFIVYSCLNEEFGRRERGRR